VLDFTKISMGIIDFAINLPRTGASAGGYDQQMWLNEEGVTAIEYALIAGLIAVVIVAAVTAVGGSLSPIFNAVAAAF
jgi:pilus assembly protein Flp/PilA